MKKRWVVTVGVVVVLLAVYATNTIMNSPNEIDSATIADNDKSEHVAHSEWDILGRTSDVHHHSPLAQVNHQNIKELGLAWSVVMPTLDGLVGNPLVSDGVIYQSGALGRVYANDARTGEELWVFDAEVKFDIESSMVSFWSSRYNRGLALRHDRVYLATGDCRVIALNKETGDKVWESVSCDRSEAYGITGAPRVGTDKIFVGNNCLDSGQTRGFVDAFDAETGDREWRFYTVPDEPSKGFENDVMRMAEETWGTEWWEKTRGCGSVWDAMTYDEQLDLLYIGTAGPAPWSPEARGTDAGDELFTNSIVALDANTGEYVWHYKTTPQDAWNFDATMHIMIAELPVDGDPRRVVMTAPKNGFFYVLDARTGEFISANNFTPVNWASHIDQETGRPVTIPDARYWEQPDGKAVASPGPLGAKNWQAMAYNPQEGFVYIPVIISPTLMEVDPKAQLGGVTFDMYYGLRSDTDEWVAKGELVAWDPVQQKARWRADRNMPMNGGVLSTAGNLVFQGAADGTFDAYRADTGEHVWSMDVPGTIMAAPSTVILDGEQYIFAPVGNAASAVAGTYMSKLSTKPELRGASRLLALKLGGEATMPEVKPAEVPKPPRPRASEDQVKAGRLLFEQNLCVDCHGLDAEAGGGSIPDLRFSSAETHNNFAAIVKDGTYIGLGMPGYSHLTMDEVEAIRAYVIDEAWKAYEARESIIDGN